VDISFSFSLRNCYTSDKVIGTCIPIFAMGFGICIAVYMYNIISVHQVIVRISSAEFLFVFLEYAHFWMGDYSDRGHLGPWTTRPVGYSNCRYLGPWTIRTVDTLACGLLGPWTHWPVDYSDRGHIGLWTTRPMDISAYELLWLWTPRRQNFKAHYGSSVDFLIGVDYKNVIRVAAHPFVMSNCGAQTLIPLFRDVQRFAKYISN
jgi:hypothetical protein